jgi:thioester reductase-like protein
VLLTGATGFLGGYLAREMLERSAAMLYCLVRPTAEAPPARLRRRLTSLGVADATIERRLRVIAGDLALPQLGLSATDCETLSTVDAVLHAAAEVNWVASCDALHAANVNGTRELLHLAARAGAAFHFVSSLSVCYSTRGPRVVDEALDPSTVADGLHLGYARTKATAERLVMEAGRQGLATRIYRPALLSGDSRTGQYNPGDLLPLMIRGCVHMRCAPDLDWPLDIEPVDVAARAIVSLSRHSQPVFHLAQQRPRHWRECLLWMRLAGYDVTLVPYQTWRDLLDRETRPGTPGAARHPLRPLRPFFVERVAAAGGLTRPELYEQGNRARPDAARTDALREADAERRPATDAALLERYFQAFARDGFVPAPRVPGTPASPLDEGFFERALARRGHPMRVDRFDILSTGSDDSIVSELTAWRSRRPASLMRVRLYGGGPDRARTLDVFVKLKPIDHDVIQVGAALTQLCNPEIARLYDRWADRLGFAASHLRERGIYEADHPRMRNYLPRLLGLDATDRTGECALILEDVPRTAATDRWTPAAIACALDGLAQLHAAWYAREELRNQPWIGYVRTPDAMVEMEELWSALARHAAPFFGQVVDGIATTQARLISTMPSWAAGLAAGPVTLIHNDFNPRNVFLRRDPGRQRLCALDWELATVGVPQRDVAEFLCFTLAPDASDSEIDGWLEHQRAALARATATQINRRAYRDGFRAALYEILTDRLAMYALIHRVRPQTFLPRVLRMWWRLYQHFPL